MTTDYEDLGRRAVDAPGWRWMPGMLAIRHTGPCLGTHRYTDDDVRAGETFAAGVPDLTDAATLGCLLALVREHCGDQYATVGVARYRGDVRWWVGVHDDTVATGDTEAEALVAALGVPR